MADYSPIWRNIYEKRKNNLIKITKQEAKKLHELGVQYGENGISRTHNHQKHYFLCESKKNLGILNKLRNKSIIYTRS